MQELKPTTVTPSAAIGNTNAGLDAILGLGSAESGLVNDAEEGKSVEPTEKAKEDQGGDQPVPISSWYSSWGLVINASGPVQLECNLCPFMCKPWFGWKKDGSIAIDLRDVTYEEAVRRMVRLMSVSHGKQWVDNSLRNLTGDCLRRMEERFPGVELQGSYPAAP